VDFAHELARDADVAGDLRGADVVVVAGDGDLDALRISAPAAVAVVVGDDIERRCKHICESTLFPRARIVGVPDLAQAEAVVAAIVFERDEEHDVVAMSGGEFGPRSARLGRGGIRELL
jgi:hypothetical protein